MENNDFQKDVNHVENNVKQVNKNVQKKHKNAKAKTIVLMVIVLVLVLVVGVLGGLLISGNGNKVTNIINQGTEKKDENKSNKKLDESKPWVYDAEYGKDKTVKKVESFSSDKDLIVPYININSEDANKANDEIKNIYEETYSKYGAAPSYTIIYSSNYEFYENDNILSIVLRVGDAVINGGAGTSKTYIYNFNLDTLKPATLKEMAILCGFNSESDVQYKVKEWEKRQNELAKANPDKVAAQMTGVVDGQYFIDKDKKLNFIYMSLAAGNYYTPAVVEPNKDIEDFYDFDNEDNSATNSIKDFSIMKNDGFANTVYENEKKQGEKFYRVSFDSNCNPTIYIEDVGVQPYATYRNFYNLKYDKTAGTKYIDFDFKILNETEDGGKGQIQYVTTSDIIIKLNYPPTDYVTLRKVTTSNNNKTATETDKKYAEEYIKIIDEVAAEYPDSNLTCDLIYFNNDDIPDLVIGVSGYWVSLYVYENGTVYNPIDNWAYGAMGNTGYDYLEKKGAIFNYNSDYAGGIGTTSIALYNSKHDFDYLAHRDKGADIDSTDSMYEEIQKDLKETAGYYYNDKKISEQEFNNKVKELSVSTDVRDYKTLDGSKTTEEVKNQLRK